MSSVPDTYVNELARCPLPKSTVAVGVNPVPVIVTDVPPAAGPDFGDNLVIVGTAAPVEYVN
jgi:hypothetical protein